MDRGALEHIFGCLVSRSLLVISLLGPSIVANNFTEGNFHMWHFGYIKEHEQTDLYVIPEIETGLQKTFQ